MYHTSQKSSLCQLIILNIWTITVQFVAHLNEYIPFLHSDFSYHITSLAGARRGSSQDGHITLYTLPLNRRSMLFLDIGWGCEIPKGKMNLEIYDYLWSPITELYRSDRQTAGPSVYPSCHDRVSLCVIPCCNTLINLQTIKTQATLHRLHYNANFQLGKNKQTNYPIHGLHGYVPFPPDDL